MSGQGFPSEGSDRRLWSWFAPLFRWLSFKSDDQPLSLIIYLVPPGFKIYFPLILAPGFFMLRAGWHWDATAKAYILGFAAKRTESAGLY